MSQQITTKYREYNTSAIQNRRYVNVVTPGVYSGYVVTANTSRPNVLDITTGSDTVSTLVTAEGVVISETATVAAAVKLAAADPNYSRYDLVVAEYVYSTDPNKVQVYKVVRGPNQLDIGAEPKKPLPNSLSQIALAYVKVRAGAPYVLTTDIHPIPKADWIDSQKWGNLRPEIVLNDAALLYVYPGSYPNSSGTSIISYPGGYSNRLSDTSLLVGSERWYIFGLTDNQRIEVVAYAANKADLPELSSDVFALARVRVRKVSSERIELVELEDMRMPFTRAGFSANEDLKYQDLLATSVFQFLRVENFETLDLVLTDITTGGSVVLDNAAKSLIITGSPGTEVVFTVGDLVLGSAISTVKQFMVAADSTIDNLEFDYSTVSGTTGYTGKRYRLNELVKVRSVFATRLFIRFYVPAAEFAAKRTTQMFSMGVLFNLDATALNTHSITELGLREITNSINNLINNGDFYYWSKNTLNGVRADLRTRGELVFPISEDSPNTADGWQFTNINTNFSSDSVRRVFITQAGVNTTALQLSMTPDASSTTTEPSVLEYRIPRAFEMSGKQVTFGIDFSGVSPLSAVTIGIAQFRRTDAGLLLVRTDENVIRSFSGTAQVTTAAAIDTNTSVLSFYIKFAAGAPITATFWHARAAIGAYPVLPYAYVADASDNLRSYYERGRFYLATYAQQGSVIGNSAQFGSPKHLELGALVTQTVPAATGDRSNNVSGVTYTSDRDSITVSATASASSSVIIQTEWESFIKYENSVV